MPNLKKIPKGMNAQQWAFCQLYLKSMREGNFDPASALAQAGYNSRAVFNAQPVKQFLAQQFVADNITPERLVGHLSNFLSRDIADLIDPNTGGIYEDLRDIPSATRDSIDSVKSKTFWRTDPETGEQIRVGAENEVKMVPKIQAAKLLAEVFGMIGTDHLNKADAERTMSWDDGFKIDCVQDEIDSLDSMELEG